MDGQVYEPGMFPIADINNINQKSFQVKGSKQVGAYTNNANFYNSHHDFGGYSSLMALFGNADGSRAQGALYDIQQPNTLFTTTAGDVQAVLEGPVGLVKDISGNGNDAKQTTAANRPTLSAKYNRTTVNNVNPTGITGLSFTNAANGLATLAAVNDAPALIAAGLAQYCTTGMVYCLDNTLGDTVARADFSGVSGVAANFTSNLMLRGSGIATLTGNNAGFANPVTALQPGYTLRSVSAVTLVNTSVRLNVNAGSICYFILQDYRLTADTLLGIPALQLVRSATDYDSAGFPRYLQGDGVTDFLVTDAINFSATDKMTVVAGVGKLSDAGVSVVAENFGLDWTLNAPRGAGPSYGFDLRFSGLIDTVSTSPYTAPTNNVVSGVLNRAGAAVTDQVAVKVNGLTPTQAVSGTGPVAPGNFSNDAIYLFSRQGTSLFFSGRLYGLAICGRKSDPYPLYLAEEEMGSKMGLELAA